LILFSDEIGKTSLEPFGAPFLWLLGWQALQLQVGQRGLQGRVDQA